MRKAYFFLIIILMFQVIAYGQSMSEQVDILWGEKYKKPNASVLKGIVAYDDKGFYALDEISNLFNRGKREWVIRHHDRKLGIQKEAPLDLGSGRMEGVFRFGGKLCLLYSLPDVKRHENRLLLKAIDPITLKLSSQPRKLLSIYHYEDKKGEAGSFYIRLSSDSSKMMAFYNFPYKKRENERFGLSVYDRGFNLLWKKERALLYKEQLFSIERCVVGNSGNVYMLAREYHEKNKLKVKGKPNYQYKLLGFGSQGELGEWLVGKPELFLTSLELAMTENGGITVGGFYAEKDAESAAGSFFFKIDNISGKVVKSEYSRFAPMLLNDRVTGNAKGNENQEKKASKKTGSGELYSYQVRKWQPMENGDWLLVGEQFYVSSGPYSRGEGVNRSTLYYHYNDIILFRVSKDGTIIWNTRIPKKQVSSSDFGYYSSFILAISGKDTYLIFNDNPENLSTKPSSRILNFNLSLALVTMVKIDQEGRKTREGIFTSLGNDVLIRPKVSRQVSPNEVILYGQRNKLRRFARLTFK